MIKQYFKQAWTMMRQNKLFTSIYVAGTGLSIAFTMVLFIIYYVKFAPVYPEYNRNRTLVISHSAIAQEGAEKWNNLVHLPLLSFRAERSVAKNLVYMNVDAPEILRFALDDN